ncbi:MAG: HAD family phosphatase [Aestuariivirga sp.]
MSISHIIFDCDGVLVNSEPLSARADAELMAQFGLKMDEAEFRRQFMGRTFEYMVEELSAKRGTVFPDNIVALKNQRLSELYRSELQLVRGVRDALETIKGLGLSMSVASNSPRELVKLALQVTGLLPFFRDQITTYEDVPNGKPEPDIYLLAAKRSGSTAENCLAVEDSIFGVKAAVDAGCWTLGFTGTHDDGHAHGLKLRDIGAEALFSKMMDLPALVSTFVVED